MKSGLKYGVKFLVMKCINMCGLRLMLMVFYYCWFLNLMVFWLRKICLVIKCCMVCGKWWMVFYLLKWLVVSLLLNIKLLVINFILCIVVLNILMVVWVVIVSLFNWCWKNRVKCYLSNILYFVWFGLVVG